jgi:hypothetical protein
MQVNPGREAGRVKLPAGEGVGAHPGAVGIRESGAGRFVGDRWVVVALDHNRFQALCSHHGPHTHPGGLVAAFADDAGKAHQVFAGWADGGGVDRAPQSGLQPIDRLRHRKSPQIGSVMECHLSVCDDYDCGMPGDAMKHQAVHTAALEGDTEGSFAARLAYATGERAFRSGGEARQAGVGVPSHNAGGQD